jgi:DNA-binding response OmpR family regulator
MSRILCVEDHDDSCEMLTLLLRSVDTEFEVESVSTGAEALEVIKQKHYDAFVLDLMLPDVDGIDLCKEIKAIDESAPVVFYTARADDNAKLLAEEAGADEFLVKPNDIDRIGIVLAQLLKYGEDPQVQLSGRGL